MMVMRLDIDLAAFAAFDHRAMGVVMADINQQFRFAAAAAIGFVSAAFTQRLAGGVFLDLSAFGAVRVDYDHVELRHWTILFCRRRNTAYSEVSRKSVS